MTARISLILGKTRGHRPRLQMLLHEFRNTLVSRGCVIDALFEEEKGRLTQASAPGRVAD